MSLLKGIALGLAGFFLFVSLSILGLFVTLNVTILNPDFIVSETEKLDITGIVSTYIKDQLSNLDQSYISALDATITQEKPWIYQQIKKSVYASYDYLLGASDQLHFDIPLGEIKQNLSDNLVQSILRSPPPEYQRLVPQDKEVYLHNLKQQIQEAIPSNYNLEINRDIIGADGIKVLKNIKEGIRYFKTAFWVIICFIVLMILLIALIERRIRGIFRVLGIIFLISGVLEIVTYFVLKLVLPLLIPASDLPAQINSWLPIFINDLVSPAGLFGLIVLLPGGICLTTSFLVKEEKAAISS